MKKVYLIILTTLLISCNIEKEIDLNHLIGTWVESQSSDLYDSETIHKIIFSKNGTYQNRVYDLKDSLINKFDGTYEIDKETNKIKMTNSGYVLKDMSLTELTKIELTAIIFEDIEGTAELNFTKK